MRDFAGVRYNLDSLLRSVAVPGLLVLLGDCCSHDFLENFVHVRLWLLFARM